MNYRQIEIFRAVMNRGSMTLAASDLGISQPGVSKMIVSLEESCGYQLFTRHAGRISSTPEAKRLMESVDRVFVGIRDIQRMSEEIRDTATGTLEIAAFPAFAARFLPKILAEFMPNRKAVHLSLHGMASRRVIEQVAAQKVDVGLSITTTPHPNVEAQLLCTLQRVCVLPLNHPLAKKSMIDPHDLLEETIISLDPQDPERLETEVAFRELGIGQHKRIKTMHSDSACALVANGLGITISDPFTPSVYTNSVIVRSISTDVPMNIWLLWPKHRTRSKLVEEFMKAVSAEIANLK